MRPLTIILIICTLFSCAAPGKLAGVQTMDVQYDVYGDSVELQYSTDGATWLKNTVLTQQQIRITRPYRPYNRLKIMLNDEVVYSKVIYLR